jgi:hypothetical protein
VIPPLARFEAHDTRTKAFKHLSITIKDRKNIARHANEYITCSQEIDGIGPFLLVANLCSGIATSTNAGMVARTHERNGFGHKLQ